MAQQRDRRHERAVLREVRAPRVVPPLLWIAEAQLEVLEPLVEELLCVVGEAERRRLAELVVLVEREQVLVQGARALSRDPIGAAVDEPPDCA
jgi:hypothetical protein